MKYDNLLEALDKLPPPPPPHITKDCPICKGSGFSGYGTGYDDVCGNCIAGQVLAELPNNITWDEELDNAYYGGREI